MPVQAGGRDADTRIRDAISDIARANPSFRPPKPGLLGKALRVVADAKEISQPASG